MDQLIAAAASNRETDLTMLQDRIRNITLRLTEVSNATRIAVGGVLGMQEMKEPERTNDPEPCFIQKANSDCESMESDIASIGDQINRL